MDIRTRDDSTASLGDSAAHRTTGFGFDHTEPYFEYLDRGYRPNLVAKSPWGDTLLGGVVGGLLACALEREAVSPGWQPARLTVDILRPVAMTPLRVHAKVVHRGRRARVADAIANQGEAIVARASALFLLRGEQPEQQVWTAPVDMPPIPTAPIRPPRRLPFFSRTFGWDSLAGAGANAVAAVPKYIWVAEVRRLIDVEEMTPFTRAAIAADLSNPLVHLGTTGLHFINTDYTLTMSRLPSGRLVGLAAQSHSSHDGVATGVATIFDEYGQIGSSTVNSLFHNTFQSPYS